MQHIIVVLDRSGSMGSIAKAAIDGFNSFVDEQRSVPGEAALTLVQFNSNVEVGKTLPTEVFPICDKQPEHSRERARNYTLVHSADALICVGGNDHLVGLARDYDLLVYEVA